MRTGITGGEGNEGWCYRVVSTARTVRASRGRHNPLPAVAPRERRDGDASAPPPHGPPTYRERVAVPGWAGLISVCKTGHMGLAFPIPTRIWAFLFARGAEEPDRRGMMWNAERRWRGWGHGFLASAVQHEWDGDSTSTLVQ